MLKKLLFAAAIATAMTANAQVIWTGSQALDWNAGQALQIGEDKFANIAAGDQIKVNFTMGTALNYGNMFFCIGSDGWPHMANNDSRTNINEYNSYPEGTTNSAVTVAAADVAGLKASGLALMGENLTLTSVEIVGSAEVPPANVWEGPTALPTWNEFVSITPAYTKDLKQGDKITIYFTVNDAMEYGQLAIKNTSWSEIAALNATMTNTDDVPNFQKNVTSTVATIPTAEIAADLAANGFYIQGQNVTVTKVVCGGEDTGNDNPGTGEEPGDKPSTGDNVWTGNFDGGNWGNLEIAKSYCAGLKGGDKIAVEFTVGTMAQESDGSVYGKMIFKSQADNWPQLTETNKTFTNVDTYGAFQPGTTSTEVTLTDADAAALAEYGCVITAYNVTITKVTFGATAQEEQPGEPAGIVSVDNSNAPVEYYNLQGVRVNEPAQGTIVIRRQGTEVKKVIF